jgi:hypothetical protein
LTNQLRTLWLRFKGEVVRQILQSWFFKWVLSPVVLLGGFGWGYFQFNYPTIYYRFKLAVEVQTPSGVKSGSVVNEGAYTFSYFGKEFMPSAGGNSSRAEALFVDLGAGKNLIVTLFSDPARQNSIGSLDMGALATVFCDNAGMLRSCRSYASEFRQALMNASRHGPYHVNIQKLPELVTLADVNDYKSMERLFPTQIDAVLGSGYAIKSASIEITDEPLVEKIFHYLPWLEKHANDKGSFDGSQAAGPNSPVFSTIGYFSFKLRGK